MRNIFKDFNLIILINMVIKCLEGNSFMGLKEIKPYNKCKLDYKCNECSMRVCKKCSLFKSNNYNTLIYCRSCVLNKWVRSCNDPNLAWYIYTENDKLYKKNYNIELKKYKKNGKDFQVKKKCCICHNKLYTNYKGINQKCKKCREKMKNENNVINNESVKNTILYKDINLTISPDSNRFSDLEINPNEEFVFCPNCNDFIELCNCI